jgi:hypothetical protein
MTERHEAIAFLQSKGVFAQEAQWAGGSIYVGIEPFDSGFEGILGFKRGLHIYRRSTAWVVTNHHGLDEEVESLDKACVVALLRAT